MVFRIKKLYKGIYHLHFKEQKDLTMSFLRLQEFYESPKFRGKVFTLKEFKAWYAKKYGRFSYATDWSGFNIPGSVFEKFLSGEMGASSKLEENLIYEVVKRVSKDQSIQPLDSWYVIGTFGKNPGDTLLHEIAHAFFATRPAYKKEALKIVKSIRGKGKLEKLIRTYGYHENSLLDEMHAYLACDLEYLKKEGLDIEPYKKASQKLRCLLEIERAK